MREDIWQPLRYFEGKWTGTGRGEPGTATVKRDYSFMLSGRYLQVRSESKWEPTEKNPEGEVHTEMGMFSYDKARKLFVLRVFHVEGFVNQYVQDTQATKGVDLRFMSEAIENISPGWRARESYRILGRNEFVETFELAEPGKDFELYTESKLKRAK